MDVFATEFVRVVITFDDGSCRVMSFVKLGRGNSLPHGAVWMNRELGIWIRPPNPENISFEIADVKWSGAQPVSWRIGSEDDLTDPTFRGARVDSDKGVAHNMVLARALTRQRLRIQRNQAFVRLDGEWMRAVATGDKRAAEIEAQRQRLRDAPADPRIDNAQTIEDLKAIQLPG